eukprot:jgi/Antlo1/1626/1838
MLVTSLIRFMGLGVCVYALSPRKLPQSLANERYNFPYSMVYITNIGLVLTFASLLVGLFMIISDMLKSKRVCNFTGKAHTLLALNSVGLETIITIGFWTLYTIDPRHVTSIKLKMAGYDNSAAKQLAMHVFPLFFALHEGWMARPQRSYIHHVLLLIVALLYYLFSRKLAAIHGRWQYSFMDNMSEHVRIAVFACFMALGQTSIEVFIFMQERLRKALKADESRKYKDTPIAASDACV